jgi:hypothetical protein
MIQKALNVVSIIMIVSIGIALVYNLAFRKPLGDYRPQTLETHTHFQGNMKYLVFISGSGEMEVKNYTLDSMEYASQKKFLGPDSDR